MGPAGTVYLIRHGATDANLRRPYVLQGCRLDLPLGELGRRQAEATARALEKRAIQAVFTSPMSRAYETANIIAKPHNLQPQTIDAFIECNVGDWEGLSWEEIQRRDSNSFKAFEADPATVPYAGGESFQQVQDRAIPALDQLIRNRAGDFVVVTHNIVGRVIIAKAMEMPTSKSRSIHLDNAGISMLSIQDGRCKLIMLNSVLHLS